MAVDNKLILIKLIILLENNLIKSYPIDKALIKKQINYLVEFSIIYHTFRQIMDICIEMFL